MPQPLQSVAWAGRLERLRVTHSDGASTTVHVASYHRDAYTARVAALGTPAPLARWCDEHGVGHALVGGFFTRPGATPLGQLIIGGEAIPSVPFDAPWGLVRACVSICDGEVRIDRRDRFEDAPCGDLLQAGPLLVSDGEVVIADGDDSEGFSAGSRQFDSDISVGRYPRAALGLAGDYLLAVACDGRADGDTGMTLSELGELLVALGAEQALNLDGGGSASLVYEGRLRNRPREAHGIDLLEGRPVATAILFERR